MNARGAAESNPMIGLGAPMHMSTCSRADCKNPGRWRLDWRNPRIHSTDRVKTWLACDDHVDYLREFLAARDFPLTVSPLGLVGPGHAGDAQ